MRCRIGACVLGVGFAACEAEEPGMPAHVSAALRACAAVDAPPPDTIAAAVTRLDALPGPVDAPCFVASLPRPFDVVATDAIISAQPAVSAESPRIFLLLGGLDVSVVPEGESANLLEFGQWTSPVRTVKAEVPLPVTAPLDPAAPFDRVLYAGGGTSCGLCHPGEAPSAAVPGGYESDALQPHPLDLVDLASLADAHDACVQADDRSDRCALFHALFDFGEVRQGAFDPAIRELGG